MSEEEEIEHATEEAEKKQRVQREVKKRILSKSPIAWHKPMQKGAGSEPNPPI
jgi:hypothetical protein